MQVLEPMGSVDRSGVDLLSGDASSVGEGGKAKRMGGCMELGRLLARACGS